MYLINVQRNLVEELQKSYMEAYGEYCKIPKIRFIRRLIAKNTYQALSRKWWDNIKILEQLLNCEYKYNKK